MLAEGTHDGCLAEQYFLNGSENVFLVFPSAIAGLFLFLIVRGGLSIPRFVLFCSCCGAALRKTVGSCERVVIPEEITELFLCVTCLSVSLMCHLSLLTSYVAFTECWRSGVRGYCRFQKKFTGYEALRRILRRVLLSISFTTR